MAIIVKKWGNSLAVRLPQAVVREANISLDQEVRVTASGGKIIIEPAQPSYEINALVSAITAANRHESQISSAARGAEEINW